jgi:hypothetical protein
VGIKDISENNVEKEVKVEASDHVVVDEDQWRPVVIPLSKFADAQGPVNMASVRNINFGFNQAHGSGNICIDDIAFK